jgi:hypothetical protein
LMDMQEKKVFVEVELASGYARAMWDWSDKMIQRLWNEWMSGTRWPWLCARSTAWYCGKADWWSVGRLLTSFTHKASKLTFDMAAQIRPHKGNIKGNNSGVLKM